MQKFLHSSFSRLCIYTFLGVTQQNINEVLTTGNLSEMKFKEEEKKLLSLKFKSEESSFEKAFNILFIAICYSGLIKPKYLKDKMNELTSEMLREIGKAATDSLIKSLASKSYQIRSEYKNLKMDGLTISYGSVISEPISCYWTRLEMDKKFAHGDADGNLEDELNRQLLQCELAFDSVVKNNRDNIEVKHTISSLRFYKPVQLNSPRNSDKRYFPAKISIKIWPEGDSELIYFFMGESTSDPPVTVTTTTYGKSGVQVQFGTGGARLALERKCGRSTDHSLTRTCWKRNRDIEDLDSGRQASGNVRVIRQAWILEDKLSGVSAFDYEPRSRKEVEYKALATLAGSNEPFIESGGINFEGEEGCGPPMTWKFKRPPNRNLEGEEGKCLKWAVEVEIGVAYYCDQYMEVRSKKFGGISLVQPIEDSIQQPTLVPLGVPLLFIFILIWVYSRLLFIICILIWVYYLVYNRLFK